MENALEVDGLTVRFGQTEVLKNLSFALEKGKALAVIGPNGAGKTVLFQTLIGALPAEGRFEGSIRWARDTRIGYVPQKLDIERDVPITAMDFLRARAHLHPRSSSGDMERVLELTGISAAAARSPIGTLSGGQFQRLLIAFALLGSPSVLMLDEPTAGVDEPGQKLLNELIRQLREERGLTVLFISHEISVVYQYATTVLCLGHGSTCFGAPTKILMPELLHEIYGTPLGYHVHEH
ncbi:MAG TPA: metal ABC transporter ATP-binding protein [Bryobacteraceae bacterium]